MASGSRTRTGATKQPSKRPGRIAKENSLMPAGVNGADSNGSVEALEITSVGTRMSEYIAFSRAKMGFQPAAVSKIGNYLEQMPGVKMKRRIRAPGLAAAADGEGATDGYVFEATADVAEELKQTASSGVIVEHNARLRHYGVLDPHFASLQPMLAAASLASRAVRVRVTAPDGAPVRRATITA